MISRLARAGWLGLLLLALIGCPTPPKKNSTKNKANAGRNAQQVPEPAPPGAFPSLVTKETFALSSSRPADSASKQQPAGVTPKQQPAGVTPKQQPAGVTPEQRPKTTAGDPQQDQPDGKGMQFGHKPGRSFEQMKHSFSTAQQQMVDKLEQAWKIKPDSRHHLTRLLNYLLLIEQPVAADRLLDERKALSGYDGKHYELELVLARLDRRLGRSRQAYDRLDRILRREKNLLPLRIPKALFTDGHVPTYGKQLERRTNHFGPGGYFRLYIEVENFVLSDAGKGQYNVLFKVSLSIYSASGQKMQWDQGTKWLAPQEAKDSFRSYLRDIMLPTTGYFPDKIPAGNYELIIELEDLNKQENKRTVKRLQFVIRGR